MLTTNDSHLCSIGVVNILESIVKAIWYLILLNLSIAPVEAQTSKSTNGKMQIFDVSEYVNIHTMIYGEGPPIIMLPGLAGSGIEQFTEMGVKISENGYTVVLVDPRGVGNSSGPLDSLTLHHLASDVATIIDQLDLGKAVIVGKAFGNRVARCVAADYPKLINAVVLISAGGLVPASSEVLADLRKYISGNYLNDDERLDLMQKTMFSAKSDVRAYPKMSFYPKARDAQIKAIQSTPMDDWWSAGSSPVLIIQGLDDLVAVPENGRILKQQLGDRAELVEISDAGHFLHLEKSEEVLGSIIDYLKKMN